MTVQPSGSQDDQQASGTAPSLVAEGLTFRWPGGFALGPVDLELGAGLWWLEGRNGAGKTTLLRCLCGALQPLQGKVRVCGRDPIASAEARRLVSWAPARADLPDFLTVDEAWQSLAALRGAPRWDGTDMRDRLGLPGSLRIAHGSAGQRRLAGLLAAMAGDPPVLLLDEPLANVDPDTRRVIAACFDELRTSRVLLVTSHGSLQLEPDGRACLESGSPLEWRAG